MRALVVYESLWGNTAAIARAVAEGIGDGATAKSVAEVSAVDLEGLDLIVAGAPLLGFSLPTRQMRDSIGNNPAHAKNPPDLAGPTMRDWLANANPSAKAGTGFETRIWWSPGSAAKRITRILSEAGVPRIVPPQKFLVEGTYGPLKAGELERASAWGAELATSVGF